MTASATKSLVSIGTVCIATGFCGCAIAVLSPYSIAGLGFCAMAAFSLMQEAFIKPSMSLETRQEDLQSTLKSVGFAVAWYSVFRLAVMYIDLVLGAGAVGGVAGTFAVLTLLIEASVAWFAWYHSSRHSFAVLDRGAAAVHELIADAYSLIGWRPPSPFHTRDRPAANQPAAVWAGFQVPVPAGIAHRALGLGAVEARPPYAPPPIERGGCFMQAAPASLRAGRGGALAAPAALTALNAFSRPLVVGAS